MKHAKHTPGPWSLSFDGKGILALSNKGTFMQIGWAHEVSFPDGTGLHSVSAAEATANARLIAAAPELLEALQSYIDDIDGKRLQNGMDLEARMRTAVAKATGQTEK